MRLSETDSDGSREKVRSVGKNRKPGRPPKDPKANEERKRLLKAKPTIKRERGRPRKGSKGRGRPKLNKETVVAPPKKSAVKGARGKKVEEAKVSDSE